MQLAYELARRSAALRFEDLPLEAVHWAKVGILDTVGVTVAGSVEPCARILGRVVSHGPGASLLFGSADRAGARRRGGRARRAGRAPRPPPPPPPPAPPARPRRPRPACSPGRR